MSHLTVAERIARKNAARQKTDDMRRYRRIALNEQGGICFYCHAPLTHAQATGDHLDPECNGGGISYSNIRAACARCNGTKRAWPWRDFLARILSPGPEDDLRIWMIHAERCIWDRTWQACARIDAFAGLSSPTYSTLPPQEMHHGK